MLIFNQNRLRSAKSFFLLVVAIDGGLLGLGEVLIGSVIRSSDLRVIHADANQFTV